MATLLRFMDRAHRPILLRLKSLFGLGSLCLTLSAGSAPPVAANLPCGAAPVARPFGALAGVHVGVHEGGPTGAQGGGQDAVAGPSQSMLNIRADSQEKDKDSFRLHGHVEVTYQEMKLTADEASYEAASGEIAARGHVTFTEPDAHLEADEAHYNLRTQRGRFVNGHGSVHSSVRPRPRMLVTEKPFYFQARSVERLDRDNFQLAGVRLSSCENEKTAWFIAAAQARLKVDDRVVARGAVFRLLGVPLLYAPVLVNSIGHRTRQSGFLLPHFGNSSQKGFIMGDGFFWAINPSADLLLGVENFSVRGPGGTARFRARPSATSDLTIDYFGVNDRGGGRARQSRAPGQSIRAVGQASNLGWGFRGVVDLDYITSLAFRQTFTDNFTQAVASEVHQTGFVSKNFDAYSVNIFASRYQDFLCAQPFGASPSQAQNCPSDLGQRRNDISIRETPSFSFTGMDKQAGESPFFFSFEASAAAVGRAEPGFETPRLSERVDFSPQVTLRSKPFLGFHFAPSAGLRATHYGASLTKGRDSLNRLFGDFALGLRPPSFGKVFSRPLYGYRFKHVIEPELKYRLVRASEARNLNDIVRFDPTDILAETNEIEYSLVNSLLIRKDAPGDAAGRPQARELLSLRLSQKYYFDPTFGGALQPGVKVVFDPTITLTGFAFAQGRRLSPLVSVLKFAPSSNYDTELRADFNPSGGGVLNAGITSHLHRGPVGLAVTDFFVNRTASLSTPVVPAAALSTLHSFNLLRVVATYGEISRKGFSGALGLDYNFAQGIAHQVVSQASYNFGCFALDFEYRRFALGTLRRENQFRIALSLANVGTFGNLKPRERLY